MNNRKSPFPYIVGFVIMALGFFFLAGLLAHFDPSSTLQKYWPVLLILLGLGLLGSSGHSKAAPLGMIFLGILFVFERAGVFNSTNGRFFFVLLLGLLGLTVLIMSISRQPDEYQVQSKITEAEYKRAQQTLEEYDRQR